MLGKLWTISCADDDPWQRVGISRRPSLRLRSGGADARRVNEEGPR